MFCPICDCDWSGNTCLNCKIAVGEGGAPFLAHCCCVRCNAARGGAEAVRAVSTEQIEAEVKADMARLNAAKG